MIRLAFALALTLCGAAPARAELLTIAPPADCKPADPGKNLRVALPSQLAVSDVLKWATSTVCQTFRIESALAGRQVTVTVGAPMTVEQSRGLLRGILLASGLMIKLGDGAINIVADPRKIKATAGSTEAPGDAFKLKARLVATVVGAEANRGVAITRDGKGGQKLFSVGERVEGMALLAVAPGRAFLKQGKKLGHVGIGEGGAPPALPAGLDPRAAIKQLDPARFEVAKRLAEWALADPKATLGMVQYAAEVRGDQIYGWRVWGFKAGSVPWMVGVRPNDTLTAINGISLGDPDQILVLIFTLKSATRVVLTVDRGGKMVDLEYAVR
jgi:general secretion pathway protein C